MPRFQSSATTDFTRYVALNGLCFCRLVSLITSLLLLLLLLLLCYVIIIILSDLISFSVFHFLFFHFLKICRLATHALNVWPLPTPATTPRTPAPLLPTPCLHRWAALTAFTQPLYTADTKTLPTPALPAPLSPERSKPPRTRALIQ